MLKLRQLEAFRATILSGSVTQAAEMLGVSQPAVSRLISHLERDLDLTLFQRRRGRLEPTPEAQVLFDEVERTIANLEHIDQLARDIRDRRRGHLRVACLPGFATSLLPRVLSAFLVSRPGTTLAFQPRGDERVREAIAAQQYDVGIAMAFEGHPAIEHENILLRSVCVMAAGHRLAERAVVTPADLDGEPLITVNRDQPHYRAVREAFEASGSRLDLRVETRQFGTACIMANAGVGVAVVSEIDAEEQRAAGMIIRPFEPTIPFGISLLYPAYRPRSLLLDEFIAAFRASLAPFLIGQSAS